MTFRECSTRPTGTVDKLSAERTLYRVKYSTLYFTWKISRFVSQVGMHLRGSAVWITVLCRIVLRFSILGIDNFNMLIFHVEYVLV